MKTHHIQSVLLFVAGIAFLIAAPQYAKATRDAPTSSLLEFVLGAPAAMFTVAGIIAVVVAVAILVIGSKSAR